MGLDTGPGNRQAQAKAAKFLGDAQICLLEWLEYPRKRLAFNADPESDTSIMITRPAFLVLS